MIVKASKKRNLVAFLQVKLFVENLRLKKKNLKKQNERSHDRETLKSVHTKIGALSQASLLLNCRNISSLSRNHWWS